MERLALSAVVSLVKTSGAFELEDVLQYRVTDECLSIYNADETLRNSKKQADANSDYSLQART